jgi:hypothetical protein
MRKFIINRKELDEIKNLMQMGKVVLLVYDNKLYKPTVISADGVGYGGQRIFSVQGTEMPGSAPPSVLYYLTRQDYHEKGAQLFLNMVTIIRDHNSPEYMRTLLEDVARRSDANWPSDFISWVNRNSIDRKKLREKLRELDESAAYMETQAQLKRQEAQEIRDQMGEEEN